MRFLVPGLFVVGLLALVPHTAAAQPCQTWDLPELVSLRSTLAAGDCVVLPHRNARGEFWNVFATAGDTMVITMDRVTMLDPYLYLLNPSGVIVASNDDSGGVNSRIQFVAQVTGMHRVVATTFYQLPTTDFGDYDIRFEIPGRPACQVRSLPLGVTMNGTINASDCVVQPYRNARGEIWTIAATAGDTMVIDMNRSSLSDPYLFLLTNGSQVLASNDDFGGTFDSRITFVATYTGTYRIIATSFAGTDGSYSIRFTGGTSQNTAPGPPGQPSANVSGNQVSIAWTPPTSTLPILEYILEAGNFPGGSNLGVFSMGTLTSLVASAGNGTYYIRVRARNAAGTGPPSLERSFTIGTPPGAPPGPPRNLTVSVIGRSVTLAWLAPLDGPPDAYRIEVGSFLGGSNLLVSDLPGAQTVISFNGVPVGAYYVRLRAVRGGVASVQTSNEVLVLVL